MTNTEMREMFQVRLQQGVNARKQAAKIREAIEIMARSLENTLEACEVYSHSTIKHMQAVVADMEGQSTVIRRQLTDAYGEKFTEWEDQRMRDAGIVFEVPEQ